MFESAVTYAQRFGSPPRSDWCSWMGPNGNDQLTSTSKGGGDS